MTDTTAAQVQVVSDPLDQFFGGTSTFAPVGSVLDDPSFSSDPYSSDEFSDTTRCTGQGR